MFGVTVAVETAARLQSFCNEAIVLLRLLGVDGIFDFWMLPFGCE